jgi:hypothetical protein
MKRMTVENFGKSDDDFIEIWGRCHNGPIFLGDILVSSSSRKRFQVDEIDIHTMKQDCLHEAYTASLRFRKLDKINPEIGEYLDFIGEAEELLLATRELIKYCQTEVKIDHSSDVWLRLNHLFYQLLENAKVGEIIDAINLDANLELPFFISCDLHQKMIFLEDENPHYLVRFADFLRLNGNSWTYLADYLEKVATKLEKKLEK